MKISQQESKLCKICNINFNSFIEKMNHAKSLHDILNYKEYIIKAYYNGIEPICKCGCNGILSFKSLTLGPWFPEYKRNHWPHKKHTTESKRLIERNTKKSLIKKYGVDNVFKLKSFQEKCKKTKLEKYGNEKYNNSEKNSKTQQINFYKKLLSSDRLKEKYTPLFSENEYGGVQNKKYKFKCNQCNFEFLDNIDNGRIPRCTQCYPIEKIVSNQEKEIVSYIKNIIFDDIIENTNSILDNNMELDIFIPSKNIAIEYNGLYWHSEISGGKNRFYHYMKSKECEKKGIKLIHIFEDEWIYKSDIIKSKLKYILGISNDKVYARKCTIKKVESYIKDDFLLQYHIQGKDKSSIKLGLYLENELVSIMTFSNKRIALGNNKCDSTEYELVRFCSKYNVIGAASKLLSYFIKNYNPSNIITYADKRWSSGNLYETIGFKLIGQTLPNYWYIKKNSMKREYRFNYRKDQLKYKLKIFDENLTEWENMQLNGYDRIWDCGHLKYELIIK